MGRDKKTILSTDGGPLIRFNLVGLILFSLTLVLIATGATRLLTAQSEHARIQASPVASGVAVSSGLKMEGAWGDLLTYDIEWEMPPEYLASQAEANMKQTPAWVFAGMQPGQARELMQRCGLTAGQMDRALSPQLAKVTASGTVVSPDADLVFSLSPETRARFYQELARFGENHYMSLPAYFPGNSFETLVGGSKLSGTSQKMVGKLLYSRDGIFCFSDIEMAMRQLPTEVERTAFMQILSHNPAVMARLQIHPDTDIDKLIEYWGTVPEARVKNLRPVLEAMKRTSGSIPISIAYLLPPFARERVFTHPMPPKPGDARMDCHWSTLSFFNASSANTFNDPYFYTAEFLTNNFNTVEKPEKYGDMIVLVSKNKTLHSAVYLAGDIYFTKNGDNYMQPWTLMRLKDIMSIYRSDESIKILTFRRKKSEPVSSMPFDGTQT